MGVRYHEFRFVAIEQPLPLRLVVQVRQIKLRVRSKVKSYKSYVRVNFNVRIIRMWRNNETGAGAYRWPLVRRHKSENQ